MLGLTLRRWIGGVLDFPPCRRSGWLVLLLAFTGCELEEVTLTEPEDLLVAEVYLKVGGGEIELVAFLQWTLGSDGPSDLREATIRVQSPDGVPVPLFPTDVSECLVPELTDQLEGVCFQAPPLEEGRFLPGDRVEAEISTADGQLLRGGMILPGDFILLRPGVTGRCALPPGESLEVLWNRSDGAWAYAGEALIHGLRDALSPAGIELEEDTVTLLGLSITESDTTMVFPQEFGVFDRFDLDRDLALALQEGLPEGATAQVVMSALERNYVNWVRGGSFNPSGATRVPSLRGDGVGVLAGIVRRTVQVVGASPDAETPSCLPGS